jgi:SSS family solute:Na+ symporter
VCLLPIAVFGPIDWIVVVVYFAAMIGIGLYTSRKRQDTEDYFLGGRSLPTWAVSLSIVSTTLSAATFVGAPEQSFGGNLTYLSFGFSNILAVLIVAWLFIPRLYRAGGVTIYGYLATRFGEPSRIAVSLMFLAGRMLASGARLFIAAMPLCLLIFASRQETAYAATPGQMIIAVCVIGLVGTAYTTLGGIRTVVWTDTIQFFIVVGAATLSVILLLHRINRSPAEIVHILSQPTANGHGKLQLFDFSWKTPFSFWAALLGNTWLTIAVLGVDQDFAQRFLISKSAGKGIASILTSQVIGVIVQSGFMLIGLLLFIFYKRPDIMGSAAPTYSLNGKNAYPGFLLSELPTIVSGIAVAGFFAIAQGSMDSAINALASSAIADIYLPIRKRLGYEDSPHQSSEAPKLAVALMGFIMTVFAILCIVLYHGSSGTLIEFALGVMAFAYTGMLGVFLAALLTRRGNNASVIAALLTGVFVVILLQPKILQEWSPHLFGHVIQITQAWWMPIGTIPSFFVCVCGSRRGESRGFEPTSARRPTPQHVPRLKRRESRYRRN